MKWKISLLLLIAAIGFGFGTPGVLGQNCPNCPAPQYTSEVFPWPPGQAVSISFDANGTGFTPPNAGGSIELTPDPSNAAPKFSLNPDLATAFANGAGGWNGHSQADGSGVTFQQALTFGPGNWIVSPTWPKATVTYQTSGGQVKTVTIDYSNLPASTVATTSYLPDYDANGKLLIAAAAAVTLINTNGSYNVPGVGNFPLFDSSKPNFLNALQGLGTHESGHGFGLDDQHAACGDPMSIWQVNAANPGAGTNDQAGCQTSNITCCDDNEIKNSPTNFYCGNQCAPPPPPPPTGTPCPAPTPSCSDGSLAQCDYSTGKWQCINPVDCLGTAPTCSDGSSAFCDLGRWVCGTVTTSQCVGAQPTCPDGSPAACDDDHWTCPTPPCSDVCDPSCPDYDPNDPSCAGGCDPTVDPSCGGGCSNPCDPSCSNYDPSDPSCGGGCSDPCDPSCSNYDPSDPSCGGGGGGGGGCGTDCCMSINPCDIACSAVPLAQRQFWNSAGMASLRLKSRNPLKVANPECVVPASRGLTLATLKPGAAAAKQFNPLQWPQTERSNLSPSVVAQLANDAPAMGSPDAPITVVEFSDFECPYCKAMAATLSQQVLPAERGNVRLVFKYFPLRFHPWAQQAAEIGECVRKQDETAFWQLHDFFFEHQRSLTADNVEEQVLGLFSTNPRINLDQVKKCMESHETRPAVMRAIAEGEQNGVHATPTLFVNGIRVDGAQNAARILKAIDQAKINAKPNTNAEVNNPKTPARNGDASHLPCDTLAIEGGNPCLF